MSNYLLVAGQLGHRDADGVIRPVTLKSRTGRCRWCGRPMTWDARGGAKRYCSHSHRQLAYLARKRADAAAR